MEKEFLNKIKDILEKEAKRLETELAKFTEKNIHNEDDYTAKYEDYGDDADENAKEVATYGERLALERTLESELQDVKSALKSVEEGTYGKCKYCGTEMSKERLMARPTSSSCVKCKKGFKGEE